MHYTICFLGNLGQPGVKTVLKALNTKQYNTMHYIICFLGSLSQPGVKTVLKTYCIVHFIVLFCVRLCCAVSHCIIVYCIAHSTHQSKSPTVSKNRKIRAKVVRLAAQQRYDIYWIGMAVNMISLTLYGKMLLKSEYI